MRRGRRRIESGSLFLPLAVHFGGDFAARFEHFAVGGVGDVNEADLVVFFVEGAAGERFVHELEPVGADELRVAGGFEEVVAVGPGALGLVSDGDEAGMEHAAVEGAEVEFADEDGEVAPEVVGGGDAALVDVVADDVAVFRGGACGNGVAAGEAAAEVEGVRGGFFDFVADGAEVGFGDFGGEGGEVGPGFLGVGGFARCEEGVPRCVAGSPGGVEGFDAAVFGFEVGEEGELGGLAGRRFQGRDGERCGVSPPHFVVDEVADAPGVASAVAFFGFQGGGKRLDEAGIEDVGEFGPVAFAAFDEACVAVGEVFGVGGFALEADFGFGPVADGVDAPAAQALVDEAAVGGFPFGAVFALEVGAPEDEAAGFLPGVVTVQGVFVEEKFLKFGLLAGEVFKPGFAPFDGGFVEGAYAGDALGEEEAAFGVDEPPFFADFFGAEVAGGFALGAGFPAAVLIPIGGGGFPGEFAGFGFALAGHVFQGSGFARPGAVFVLAEGVDEGEEGGGVAGGGDVGGGAADGFDAANFELVCFGGVAQEEDELGDVGRVERLGTALR